MNWNEASAEAKRLISGVTRGRVAASEPGVEWAYLDWGGEGEVVSLLHANGFCAATLAPIADALRSQYRVLAFDVRGHGDSTPMLPAKPTDYAWTRLAADYAAALSNRLREIGASRVRYGLGHSFGGVLSLGAAAEMPGVFGDLVLLDPVILPAPVAGEPDPFAGGEAEAGGVENPMAAAARRRQASFPSFEDAFDHLKTKSLFKDFRQEALALYILEGFEEAGEGPGIRLKCHPEVEAAVFDNGRSIQPFAFASQVDARTTILHASGGYFSKDVLTDLAAALPNGTVQSAAGGHLFPMERPEEVLAALPS